MIPEAFKTFLDQNGSSGSAMEQAYATKQSRRYIRLNSRMNVFCLEDLPDDPMFPSDVVEAVSWLPASLRCYSLPSSTRLVDLQAYKNRQIFGVDAATLAAVQCLDVHRDHDVLDLCCAPGSKLFAIADMTDQDVIGVDVSSTRLGVCRKLANQHYVQNCFLIEADGVRFNPWDPGTYRVHAQTPSKKARKNQNNWNNPTPPVIDRVLPDLFDRVLVDAECTHDGSVRHVQKYGQQFPWESLERRVLNPERLAQLFNIQLGLLKNGWDLLRPGGRLVYSTCSLCPTQNQGVIEAFLDDLSAGEAVSPGLPFELSPDGRPIPNSHLVPALPIPVKKSVLCGQGDAPVACLFDPTISETSGLFMCVLEKTSGPETPRTVGSDYSTSTPLSWSLIPNDSAGMPASFHHW